MKKFYIVFLLLFINICIINNTVNVKADAPEGYDKTYYVRINIAFGVINVYEKDNSGNYGKIAIALPCSLPDNIEEYKDTTAIIRASRKWTENDDGTWLRYYVRMNNDMAFSTVPYEKKAGNTLIAEEYNKLGVENTDKDIRLTCSGAKWIFENLESETMVEYYEDKEIPGEYGIPRIIRFSESSKDTNWDPTDDSQDNPWNSKEASITHVNNRDMYMAPIDEMKAELLKDVKGYDKCGNDITEQIVLSADGAMEYKEGKYTVTYSLTDSTGSRVSKEATVNVKKPGQEVVTNNTGTEKKVLTKDDKIRRLLIIGFVSLLATIIILHFINRSEKRKKDIVRSGSKKSF